MAISQARKARANCKNGAIVDAGIIDTPLKPKGRTSYEIATDRPEEEQPCVDTDARWVKKAGKTRYGYKKHHVTDTEGLVLGLLTTPANVNVNNQPE